MNHIVGNQYHSGRRCYYSFQTFLHVSPQCILINLIPVQLGISDDGALEGLIRLFMSTFVVQQGVSHQQTSHNAWEASFTATFTM